MSERSIEALRRTLPDRPEQEIAVLAVVEQWCSQRKCELARSLVVRDKPRFTPMQLKVAAMLGRLSVKEIADALSISPKTVTSHAYYVLQSLGVKRYAEVALWFQREMLTGRAA